MFQTLTEQIKINKEEHSELYVFCDSACFNTKNLYNLGHQIVKDKFIETYNETYQAKQDWLALPKDERIGDCPHATWLRYGKLDQMLKKTPQYKMLPAQTAQQTLVALDKDWSSFFSANKEYEEHPEKFTARPKLPNFKMNRDKEYVQDPCFEDRKVNNSRTVAKFTNQNCKIKGNEIILPLLTSDLNANIANKKKVQEFNKTARKADKIKFIPIEKLSIKVRGKIGDIIQPFDGGKKDNKCRTVLETLLCQVRIIPKRINKEWTYLIEIVYKVRLPNVAKASRRIASADLGLDNFITLVNNTGIDPVLIKGADMKSINQYYNKELAELTSLAKKCNKKFTTKQIAEITESRNNRVKNRLHEISRYVVNWLADNNIDTLVVGKNKGWKQNVNLRNVTNQKFVQIPHAMFINMLKYKCALAGIIFIETSEAYTSKASFLDGDKFPKTFNSKRKKPPVFSGIRICRGLYRTKNGTLINADVNGAYNIMIKVFPKAFDANGIAGAVLHPVRHKITPVKDKIA